MRSFLVGKYIHCRLLSNFSIFQSLPAPLLEQALFSVSFSKCSNAAVQCSTAATQQRSAVQCTLEDDHCTAVQQRSAALKTSWWHSNHRSCIWWSSSNHQRSIHPHYCQMLSSDDRSPSKRQIQKFVNTNRDTVFVYKFSPLLKSDLWKIFAKSWQRRCHRVRLWSRYGKSPKC